jgi:hypothetical protein
MIFVFTKSLKPSARTRTGNTYNQLHSLPSAINGAGHVTHTGSGKKNNSDD